MKIHNDNVWELQKITRRECSCGWCTSINNKYKRVICKNCGKMLFLNKIDEFKYRLKERLK